MSSRPHVFGLTGGLASGKSTVARHFARLGVGVVDADRLAREVVAPGSPALRAIEERFGSEVIAADGALDRAAMARLVFRDPGARAALEAITHPRIQALREQRVAELAARGCDLVCYEAPLIFEKSLEDGLRPVVVVGVDRATQRQRACERDGCSPEEAQRRIEAQLPLEEKLRRADFYIDASGDLPSTLARASAVLAEVLAHFGLKAPRH